jgi:serine O-acetyltransferase
VTDDIRSASKERVPLLRLLREDRHANGHTLSSPGFRALAVYRFGVWQNGLPSIARVITRPLHRFWFRWVRNHYGIELPVTATIGRNVTFGHQHGIVIHPFSQIGDGCLFRHNVTLAAAAGDDEYEKWAKQAPRLGLRVRLGVGAVIMGAVFIGDDARIGPNVVVSTDIPAGAVVIDDPPRVLRPPAPPPTS